MDKKKLLFKIEVLRTELSNKVMMYGLSSTEALQKSRQLSKYINIYQRKKIKLGQKSELYLKGRQINDFIINNTEKSLSKIAGFISTLFTSNIYILNFEGELLGYKQLNPQSSTIERNSISASKFLEKYNNIFLCFKNTVININESSYQALFEDIGILFANKPFSIAPIINEGDRLGTLLFIQQNGELTDEDHILIDYCTTVVLLEILKLKKAI